MQLLLLHSAAGLGLAPTAAASLLTVIMNARFCDGDGFVICVLAALHCVVGLVSMYGHHTVLFCP